MLITQGFEGQIISANNSVPVISVEKSYVQAVPAVVNFLRLGCPSVQVLDIVDRFGDGLHLNFLERFKSSIKELELTGEEFIIEKKSTSFFVKRIETLRI